MLPSLLESTLTELFKCPELSPAAWHKALRRTEPLHLYQTEPSLLAKCDTAHNIRKEAFYPIKTTDKHDQIRYTEHGISG